MDRRAFLRHTAAATAGVAVSHLASAEPPPRRVVDTHTHFYDPTRPEGVPWPKPGTPLYRPVLPGDWRAVAEPHGARETVVVEASARLADNDWIFALAEREKCIVGFIAHPAGAADWPKQIEQLAANPLMRGFRLSLRDIQEQVGKGVLEKGLAAVAARGWTLDIIGPPAMLPSAAALARSFPEIRFVVDHVGLPGDSAHPTEAWREAMSTVGRLPNVFCKVSGLMEQTAGAAKGWGEATSDPAYYRPVLDHCWECFGADRLVYGSNWPVSDKGGNYAAQFAIVSEYFTAKGPEAAEKYFWKNSRDAYRWVDRS